ncbi:MAG: hypothetical protein JHC31_04390 [Sulfurihydrogenibium sp.]|jgi:Zn-dependent peptidase ImmA (M78 family)|nr:hypothetical protein [Sulfurihydrogenibium sp.]
MVKQVNPEILKELAKLKPNAYQYVLKVYPQSDRWFSGEEQPTYSQLVELSRVFNVPFGYFFLDKLPEYKLPINVDFIPSEEFVDAIKFAEKIQDWAKEIITELGYEKAEFRKIQDNLNSHAIDSKLRKLIDAREIKNLKTQNELFQYLVRKSEDKGIIVLVNSYIRSANGDYKKLNIEEFKGFVLYDDIAPIIFINDNSDITSKIHTLISGIIYVLLGESVVLNEKTENKLKEFCNKCGEEILMLMHCLEKEEYSDTQRLLGIQFSERFLNLLRTAVCEDIITYRDALMITGLRQL